MIKADLNEALKVCMDFIALSFCRSSKDLKELNKFLSKNKCQPEIFAKVEDQEGIKNIREITKNSDGLMIARGDLGIETDMTNLPYVQRNMVKIASELGKKSIVGAGSVITKKVKDKSLALTRTNQIEITNYKRK